jgi:type I restriction enzyme S subunit
MDYKKIGDYIRLVDVRNKDLTVSLLRGVSTTKKLIESNANMTGVSLANYKIVTPSQFVYVADTSRRGDKIAIALNDSLPCIVSSIYTVFEIIDKNVLSSEYLFLWFNRPEFDRYARFNSWGSARETFDWDDMCEISIPIPKIEEQKRIASFYKSIIVNQKVYEKSLTDLQSVCLCYMEKLKKDKSILKILKPYIDQVSKRNETKNYFPIQGISNSRKFIETKANTTDLDFSNYKIVSKKNFAYNPSRLNIGSIAMRTEDDCIVSPMYVVFEVIEKDCLLPEYLNLWFSREAFCHYVWFYSFGSVRDTFDYGLMEEVVLPIPDIKIQEAIVTTYYALEKRNRINEKLKRMIEKLPSILMRSYVNKPKGQLASI